MCFRIMLLPVVLFSFTFQTLGSLMVGIMLTPLSLALLVCLEFLLPPRRFLRVLFLWCFFAPVLLWSWRRIAGRLRGGLLLPFSAVGAGELAAGHLGLLCSLLTCGVRLRCCFCAAWTQVQLAAFVWV